MPCVDGREEEDRKNRERRHNAMTAILCGVMRADARALVYARHWHGFHEVADEYRKAVEYDWQDARIGAALACCDVVLDEAYEVLCKKDV